MLFYNHSLKYENRDKFRNAVCIKCISHNAQCQNWYNAKVLFFVILVAMFIYIFVYICHF
jgi:hypothetical protein